MGIAIKESVETKLVEISAGLIAAGSAGYVVVDSLPPEYKVPAAAVCGALITAGGVLLGIWHKFVNVYKEKVAENSA